jgi:hypothetical protein
MTVTNQSRGGNGRSQVPAPRRDAEGRRVYEVPDTPEAREHAEEAKELELDLQRLGVVVQQVRPTLNFEGHVRLTFDGMAALLGLVDDRDDTILKLRKEVADLREELDGRSTEQDS